MAEKKHGLGTVLLVGAAAAAVAGGVVSYLKRAEIQRLAEDIISRVRPESEEDYPDTDRFCDAACAGAEEDAAEMNIVDSGLSLEAVENAEAEEPAPETGAEPEAEPETETEIEPESAEEPETASAQPEAEAEPETAAEPAEEAEAENEVETETDEEPQTDADDGQPRKKTWFWSK